MSKNSHSSRQSEAAPKNQNLPRAWVTDYAWICGVAGALTILMLAWSYQKTNAMVTGLVLGGYKYTHNPQETTLAALFICTFIMLAIEAVRLWLRDRGNYIVIDPDIRGGKGLLFIWRCLVNWVTNLALLELVIFFYHSAGEYGFQRGDAYYQPWFNFLDIVEYVYLWAGLPYVLITRALKHDPAADRRDMSTLFARIVRYLISLIHPAFRKLRPEFEELDKKAARALLVKMFFTPIMTVFFAQQFPHLVNNISYMFGGLAESIANGTYTHSRLNSDLFNLSIASIFSIDVALAWCGYVISSRWVDNQTLSAEPTMLGWMVCIVCYPPFQMFLGLYYASPGEREVLQYSNQYLVTFFGTAMVLSYLVYMSATLFFGVRFSNLTHRGIIRSGPYALVRHPAYASKNFAWWCVMFPAIIYNAMHSGIYNALLETFGLILMTWVYYMRANTEERHLMGIDPYYAEYCKQVKYRFIPGLF